MIRVYRLALASFISISSTLHTPALCHKEKVVQRKHSELLSHYAIPITAGIIAGCAASSIAQYLNDLHVFGKRAEGIQRMLWLLVSVYGCNKLRNIIIEENVSQSDEARTNGFLATLISFVYCQLNK